MDYPSYHRQEKMGMNSFKYNRCLWVITLYNMLTDIDSAGDYIHRGVWFINRIPEILTPVSWWSQNGDKNISKLLLPSRNKLDTKNNITINC